MTRCPSRGRSAGVGETMATVLEPDEGVVPVDEDVEATVDEPLAGVLELGFALSFGTLAANGLRAILARTTLAGALDGCLVVEVWLVVTVLAAGGPGSAGTLVADALLSRSTGTATTAAISAATMIHSLRSSRSRRSELIPGLQWSRADRAKR